MNAPAPLAAPYRHTPLFPLGKDTTAYRKLGADGVRVENALGREILVVSREALKLLAEAAYVDINHLLRPGHLAQLAAILDDAEASANDKFVAYDLLKNANIAAGGVLPMCQDTGTAIIMGKKGRAVWTDGDDEAALAEGARDAYLKKNLRYSQLAPISDLADRSGKFPCFHRHRRQGQRFLHGAEPRMKPRAFPRPAPHRTTAAAVALVAVLACGPAVAECKDELVASQQSLAATRAGVEEVATGPAAQKCPAWRKHYAAMMKVRAVFARCDTGARRAEHAARLDASIAEFKRQVPRSCRL